MKEHRLAFFRQGTWIIIAVVVSGGFMFLASSFIPQRFMPKDPVTGESQFGVFAALMAAMGQIGIPALGLQTMFAQQAGAANTEQQKRELAGAVRSVMVALFVVWLAVVFMAQVFEQKLLVAYKISNPTALWFTVDAALISMLSPVFVGLLQGRQNFLWFGWITIFNGMARCAAMLVLIVLLHYQAAGAMAGVFAGLIASVSLYMWRTESAWCGDTTPFHWQPWLRRLVPLTIGLGTFTYMLTRDPLVVQRIFDKTSGYNAARQVGVALIFLTTPLATVMFPKIARSHALSEKSNVLLQALGATGLMGALAALACTFFPELPLRVMSGAKYIDSAPLVPWFAWCMVPLTIANVLMNNLFARQRFGIVPWLVAVAAGYDITLRYVHGSYLQVIQVLGIFNVLLVAVCIAFTMMTPRNKAVAADAATP